jgi:hypothetical protein
MRQRLTIVRQMGDNHQLGATLGFRIKKGASCEGPMVLGCIRSRRSVAAEFPHASAIVIVDTGVIVFDSEGRGASWAAVWADKRHLQGPQEVGCRRSDQIVDFKVLAVDLGVTLIYDGCDFAIEAIVIVARWLRLGEELAHAEHHQAGKYS